MQHSFSACRSNLVVLSSKIGRKRGEKKESGDSSENGICGCGLPAHCCQPAVAVGVIYADLWGELSTHLALQAFFTQSSPVHEPLLQAFPFPSTLGKVTLHLLSQACVYIYSSRGKWVFPPLLWSFPPSTTLTSFPAPGCWVRAPAPTRASPARPACLFTVPGRIPFPQSLALSVSHPLSCVSLLFLLLISQFLFFSPGGGRSVQQAMLIWPRLVCGSTMVPWSSPCPRLPKPSGHGRLAAWGPSLFLHLTWSGDSLHWLEVWRGQSFVSSQWFCLQSVSPVSLQDFTIGGSLSASSL
jgi:hypothetical protein